MTPSMEKTMIDAVAQKALYTSLVRNGIIILILSMSILMMPIGLLAGAATGWFVGLFFEDTLQAVLQKIGLSGLTLWQVGAFLGMLRGFFCHIDTSFIAKYFNGGK